MTAQNTPAGPQDRRNTDRPRETANARAFAHTSSILPGRAACIADSMTACIADSMTDTMSGCNPCAPRGGVAQAPRRRGALIGRGGHPGGGQLLGSQSLSSRPGRQTRVRVCAHVSHPLLLAASPHNLSLSRSLRVPVLPPPSLVSSFLSSSPRPLCPLRGSFQLELKAVLRATQREGGKERGRGRACFNRAAAMSSLLN